ncbi:PfaD family polyunsaturated fatty acid/polyketide biosynthesis protein [Streptomyces sp. TRM76323]|uniref:PfaD family polyunsaturated fatty acid/polyketide biosynthesis protein n=1 Tax=Streptomyces tamarix TaxID=3078565 RepID=A0ABU3QI85_9ACTN|nr:PfaD family polyunsaturated fatty acid/polyketide biosynthesis protein [Streptomyces tamarix]MDT9682376.1 PfaD family polyunsaturated fatty acid/polyketide biosynthesis protein [Streptomyces tamarix]
MTPAAVRYDPQGVYEVLADLASPCYIVSGGGRVGATPEPPAPGSGLRPLAVAGPLSPEEIGSGDFRRHHGTRYAHMAGAMAGGIAGEELVTAFARAGHLSSFGAAGLPDARVDRALERLRRALGPSGAPYACNLLHHPMDPARERACVDACLRHGVRCVEASAFVQLTPDLVRYRVAGLERDPASGGVRAGNRVVAKVSRPETAELFLRPAPETMVADLLARGQIAAEQAALARTVAMADDITVEADSGGHTDRRPLVVMLPAVLRLRDHLARGVPASARVRVGAAGGIGTPEAVVAALALGASYVVTGSVNQALTESGTSAAVKQLLAQAGPADCTMAPAADMFEQGVTVQVLGRGTMFAGQAGRLYRLYRDHDGLESLPAAERAYLETRILRRPVADVWQDAAAYLREHHPEWGDRAASDPKHRMAMVFRWYLGMASRWAVDGDTARRGDWQVWCGPAMGAFNAWTAGSALAAPEHRHAAEVAGHLLRAAAFHSRVTQLRLAGVRLPATCATYRLPSAASEPAASRGARTAGPPPAPAPASARD